MAPPTRLRTSRKTFQAYSKKSKLKETEACGEKTTRSLAPAVLLAHEVASMWSRSWGRGPVAS
ncbi:mCG1030285, isoform CRA_a [Mus musculus]|nr:mCG1030285, isoform CRA_a [Mus musculus]EDL19072.1 mCG1030285, isoform CRA_a [Mus musculus]EDL19073.1 mCG1030285, isoform CRA_a [Mus musculus]EDL19074.1 mCG1030285, isoform CRA_a [Mus musculus]